MRTSISDNNKLSPAWVMEASWEVCNKVGGIYTVLSTHAKTLQEQVCGNLVFIGPDVWEGKKNALFTEDATLFADWRAGFTREGLPVRVGRWEIPGRPVAILVDFKPLFPHKNDIFARAWELFRVDSLHGYGDYDEASMFSCAAAMAAGSFYRHVICKGSTDTAPSTVYHAHEWMTAMGMMFLKHHIPAIGSVFTTHATSIGRSIAGNNKPLYDYLPGYFGDQMAQELNVESKHSVEKQAAHRADCFTTVSEITNRECAQLLEKAADVVLLNGFEDDFVPKGAAFTARRRQARKCMIDKAEHLLGKEFPDDTLIIGTGGRFEFRNKGFDLLLASLRRLGERREMKREVIAFINVPHWHAWPEVMDKVNIIFVPCYLDGQDGLFNLNYYDLLIGNDIGIYPSYYEPWGYTPLESIAFHVPTITTDLAGFGLWAKSQREASPKLLADNDFGVEVIHRTDSNFDEAAEQITRCISQFAECTPERINSMRNSAATLSKKALWTKFIVWYQEAYDVALRNAKTSKCIIKETT
ncbi:MAG: glycogen/starch synthase [Bacteroidaceae bacterium]|nr:glycogen/starch synthase [Bacteroidaceae bacterium]